MWRKSPRTQTQRRESDTLCVRGDRGDSTDSAAGSAGTFGLLVLASVSDAPWHYQVE